MELNNDQLERAAYAAGAWEENCYGAKCYTTFVIHGFGWPAAQAIEFDGDDNAALNDQEVWSAIDALSEIVRRYPNLIDEGRGDQVAAAFRAAKT